MVNKDSAGYKRVFSPPLAGGGSEGNLGMRLCSRDSRGLCSSVCEFDLPLQAERYETKMQRAKEPSVALSPKELLLDYSSTPSQEELQLKVSISKRCIFLFGAFDLRELKGRRIRNPRTREEIEVPIREKVVFMPGLYSICRVGSCVLMR